MTFSLSMVRRNSVYTWKVYYQGRVKRGSGTDKIAIFELIREWMNER